MQKHSLWLIPPPESMEMLRKHVDNFSQLTGNTPSFLPHVTLLGDIPASSQEILEKAAPVLRGQHPITLTLNDLMFGENFFMSFFAKLAPNEILRELHRACTDLFPDADIPNPFDPHLSLAYGTLSPAHNEQLYAQVVPMLPLTFESDRVVITKSSRDTPIEDWVVCHEIPLNECHRHDL